MKLNDFVKKDGSIKTEEDFKKEKEKERLKEIEYCRQEVLNSAYLWDMRCWDKYKDKEEIKKWIENDFHPNNCGHTTYCLRKLIKKFNFSEEEIIDLVMKNLNIQYKNRLVPCFKNPDLCPRFKEAGNYSDAHCELCET